MQEFLEVGQIVNTFGIKGFVKIVPFTNYIERFDELEKVYIKQKSEKVEYIIEEVKYQKNMVMVKFKGIERIEEAELLKNSIVLIDRENAVELEEGEYFIVDLIGLEVYTDENVLLGNLEDIYNTGSNDIYVVRNELGKQLLLPALKEVIKDIDLDNKKMIVHLIEGLI
ncbi:Ribosome maturation factor RimM [compost metagenome]